MKHASRDSEFAVFERALRGCGERDLRFTNRKRFAIRESAYLRCSLVAGIPQANPGEAGRLEKKGEDRR